jgi:hypothetical protein
LPKTIIESKAGGDTTLHTEERVFTYLKKINSCSDTKAYLEAAPNLLS